MVQLFYPEKSEFSLAAADYFCPLGLEILILRLRWGASEIADTSKVPLFKLVLHMVEASGYS